MEGTLAIMIPLSFTVLLMAIPIVAILRNILRDRAISRERMLAIEKGVEIPPMPVDTKATRKKYPEMDFRNGLIALFVGLALIGLAIYGHGWNPFGVDEAHGFSYLLVGAGLILSLTGIAKMIWFYIAKKNFPHLSKEAELRENTQTDID